jgi:hypothetical protein
MADNQSQSFRLFPCTGSVEDYARYLEKVVLAYMEYVENPNLRKCINFSDVRQELGAIPTFHQALKSCLDKEHPNALKVYGQSSPVLQSDEAHITPGIPSPATNEPSGNLRLAGQYGQGLLRDTIKPRSVKGIPKDKPSSKPRPSPSSRRTWTAEASAGRNARSRLAGQGSMGVVVWDASLDYHGRASSRAGSKGKANEFLVAIPDSESQWEELVNKTNLLTRKEVAKTFRLLTLQSSSRTTTAPFCNNGDKTSQVLGKYPKLCDHLDREANRSDVLCHFSRLILACIARVFRTAGVATQTVDAMVGHRSPKYERDTRHSAKDVASLIEQLEDRLGCRASQSFLMCKLLLLPGGGAP